MRATRELDFPPHWREVDGLVSIDPCPATEDVEQQLERAGFFDLDIYCPELPFQKAIASLGKVISSLERAPVEALRASELGAKGPNTYGGNYGRGVLPLHTDLAHWFRPPRYLVLRCHVPDVNVATLVLGRDEALRGLAPEAVSRAVFKPRRPLNGRLFLLRLLQDEVFRWDTLFLLPANRHATTVQTHAKSEWVQRASSVYLRQPGHTIIIDNWRALHGRGAVPLSTCERVVHRAYLSELNLGSQEST